MACQPVTLSYESDDGTVHLGGAIKDTCCGVMFPHVFAGIDAAEEFIKWCLDQPHGSQRLRRHDLQQMFDEWSVKAGTEAA